MTLVLAWIVRALLFPLWLGVRLIVAFCDLVFYLDSWASRTIIAEESRWRAVRGGD